MKHASFQEIACQQVMVEDASVFSVQWPELPVHIAGELDPQRLLCRYLSPLLPGCES